MRSRCAGATLAAWLVLAGPVAAAAQSAGIRVTPVVTDGQVSASFSVPTAFTDDARAVLQSGLLLTFRFTVTLRRSNGLWLDPTLEEVAVAASVKFDNLTGAYQVSKSIDEHVVWSDRTMDAGQVRAWMTTFDRIPLVAGGTLEPNAEYYIHVRMWASPRRTFSLWPWAADDGAGRADFTNIR